MGRDERPDFVELLRGPDFWEDHGVRVAHRNQLQHVNARRAEIDASVRIESFGVQADRFGTVPDTAHVDRHVVHASALSSKYVQTHRVAPDLDIERLAGHEALGRQVRRKDAKAVTAPLEF